MLDVASAVDAAGHGLLNGCWRVEGEASGAWRVVSLEAARLAQDRGGLHLEEGVALSRDRPIQGRGQRIVNRVMR